MGHGQALDFSAVNVPPCGPPPHSYGPDWDAAIDYGIDVTLLEHNLSLTPTERLEQLQQMTEVYELLRPSDDDQPSLSVVGCGSLL